VVDELGVRPPVLLIRLEEQLSQRAMAV
jgi:hypothetical protein